MPVNFDDFGEYALKLLRGKQKKDQNNMSKNAGISVCFIIRNGLKNGYPFWESLNSAVPFADEIVISEGYSDDGTFEVIQRFGRLYKDKVRIYRDNWDLARSQHGEVITQVSTWNMRRCTKSWIYYLQADEIIHEHNFDFLRLIAEEKIGKFNSVSFPFLHFIGSWNPLPRDGTAYSEAIRMVRNTTTIYLLGDAWNFTGAVDPIFPAGHVPKPVYHFGWVFPKNIDLKNLSHAQLYKGLKEYQEKAQKSRENIVRGYKEKKGLPPPVNFTDFPAGTERLVGMFEYQLPPEGVNGG